MAYNPKSYRKVIAGTMTAAMAASAFAVTTPQQVAEAQEQTFVDVPPTDTHFENIERAAERGIITGYSSDNTFRPSDNIIRGQAATMMARALDLDVPEKVEEDLYPDVSSASSFAPVVKAVTEAGVMTGRLGNTQFDTGLDVSREQVASMIVRAFDLQPIEGSDAVVEDIDDAYSAHRENIEILAQYNITSTRDNHFNPQASVTRGQMATFLERTFDVVHTQDSGLVSVTALDQNTVEVAFDHEVNAEDITADFFTFNNDLDVLDAESTDDNVITLTTSDQVEDTAYTLSFDGERTTLSFIGSGEAGEVEEVAIETAEANVEGSTATVTADVTGAAEDAEAHVAIVDADGETVQEADVAIEDEAISAEFAGFLPGEYTAEITVGDAEASVDFEITELILPLEAAAATTTMIRNEEGQALEFTVDGHAFSAAELEEAGYEVEYVFNDNDFELNEDGLFDASEFSHEDTISYAVEITDGETTVRTERQDVNIFDANVATEVPEAALFIGEDQLENNQAPINHDDEVEVRAVGAVNAFGEELDEEVVEELTVEDIRSSVSSVANYNNERLNLVNEGTTTLTVSFDGIEEAVTLDIEVIGAEELSAIKEAGETNRFVRNADGIVGNLTVNAVNQYGGVWTGDESVDVEITDAEGETVTDDQSINDEGQIIVNLNEVTEGGLEAGTYTVDFTHDDVELGSVTVEIIEHEDNGVDSYFFDMDEEVLDLFVEDADTPTGEVVTETLSVNGSYEGVQVAQADVAAALDALPGSIEVTSSNLDVVDINNGENVTDYAVEANGVGTATITLEQVEGGFRTVLASIEVTVENSAPQVTELTVKEDEELVVNAEGTMISNLEALESNVETITADMIEEIIFSSSDEEVTIVIADLYGGGTFVLPATR
ncbi:S-layer homology domain-containing protein [Geomicrobium sp. JSM 1781026]|uniref:S-layer homology domain-containing protein n=1 Tax=Geomicrobium sp. JSM 1781026 TaxID=3344580 RepID=UPI0035BFD191